jgi:4-phytase / acid phosphatase
MRNADMDGLLRGLRQIVFCLCLTTPLLLPAQGPIADSPANPVANKSKSGLAADDGELKFVVMVSRHGVRSPTGKIDQLSQYSSQPWPAWSVSPGYLTAHGAKLMTIFGSYDGELFAQQGLLATGDCADAGRVTILADSDQRTRETGKALAAGLMPGCSIEVHSLAEGTPDPLFHSLGSGAGHADKQLALAAVSGRIGNNPAGLAVAYRPQLQALEEVLKGNKSDGASAATDARPKALLFDIPSSLDPGKGDHLVDLRSPLGTAATMAENLLLEYTEGMAEVGWGRVDADKLRELMQLHTASADVERRTNYIARAQSSNLLAHILDSIQQAIEQKPVTGALSKPSDSLLILVGHDTNLTNISGALDLGWLIDGRRDDTPPGGALVFEVWKQGSGDYAVRTYFMAQTLDQMRNAAPLSLATPPEREGVFVPGCSRADGSCGWRAFQSAVRAALDTGSVR